MLTRALYRALQRSAAQVEASARAKTLRQNAADIALRGGLSPEALKALAPKVQRPSGRPRHASRGGRPLSPRPTLSTFGSPTQVQAAGAACAELGPRAAVRAAFREPCGADEADAADARIGVGASASSRVSERDARRGRKLSERTKLESSFPK